MQDGQEEQTGVSSPSHSLSAFMHAAVTNSIMHAAVDTSISDLTMNLVAFQLNCLGARGHSH